MNYMASRGPAMGEETRFHKFGFSEIDLTGGQKQLYPDSCPALFTEGRFAIVTDVGRGMRWTPRCRQTSGKRADGEVVWS